MSTLPRLTCSLLGLFALGSSLCLPAFAQETTEFEFRPEPTGLCALNELGGLWVNDGDGQLVQLEELCRRFQPLRSLDSDELIALTDQEEEFWQSFLNVASRDAIAFASTVNYQDVADYGKAVCTSLNEGETMSDVRKVQIEGGLPPAFDAAVNVAAINTYCPEYQAEIAR